MGLAMCVPALYDLMQSTTSLSSVSSSVHRHKYAHYICQCCLLLASTETVKCMKVLHKPAITKWQPADQICPPEMFCWALQCFQFFIRCQDLQIRWVFLESLDFHLILKDWPDQMHIPSDSRQLEWRRSSAASDRASVWHFATTLTLAHLPPLGYFPAPFSLWVSDPWQTAKSPCTCYYLYVH